MVTKEYVSAALRAAHAVRRAVLNGELPNLKAKNVVCSVCKNNRATQYDHRNYDKPLDVQPVCKGCNAKLGKAAFNPKNAPEPMEWSSVSVKISREQYAEVVKLAKRKGAMISWMLALLLDIGLDEQKEWMDHLEHYQKVTKGQKP